MTKINIKKVECKRCGHKWFPRKKIIYVCPKCHSPKWNER